jgi:hypothetical protein
MTSRAVTINARQQKFAELYVLDPETAGHGTKSAALAGYSAECAAETASRLLRHSGVRAEIERLNREIMGDFATVSIRYLGRLVMDGAANPKLRLEAAKTILDRGGYIAPKAAEPAQAPQKDINSLSLAELDVLLEASKAKIEALERDMIDVTPEAIDVEPAAETDPLAAAG